MDESLTALWNLDPEITYLNHGSFGPSPAAVLECQQKWSQELASNPQDFLARQQEILIEKSLERLGKFVGASAKDLLPVENATYGMNLISRSLDLRAGDEVLLTTHEYGAVKRIWQQTCQAVGAKMIQVYIPEPIESHAQITQQIAAQITDKTRLIVVSHVTSPTAMIFPVEQICSLARKHEIPVCIDGPHALAMRPLNIDQLGCDFYVASCHKWLSAPTGTGFLYVHPRWQQKMKPCIISWGGSTCGRPKSWKDEFYWQGTRDLSRFLAIEPAISLLEEYGLENFRQKTHQLAEYARNSLLKMFGGTPITPSTTSDGSNWFGSMVTVPLPESVRSPDTWTGLPHPLQQALVEKHRIEIPVIKWGHRMHLRVSCHLYNSEQQIDKLLNALQQEIG